MSVPVRRFPDRPTSAPDRPIVPPARPRPRPRTQTGRTSRPDPRRAVPPRRRGFVVLASMLVGAVVFAIVTLNVLLAQASFRATEAEQRLEALTEEHRALVREQATLSAPDRIASWADQHNMRLPDDIQILHVTTGLAAGPAGAGTGVTPPDPGGGTAEGEE